MNDTKLPEIIASAQAIARLAVEPSKHRTYPCARCEGQMTTDTLYCPSCVRLNEGDRKAAVREALLAAVPAYQRTFAAQPGDPRYQVIGRATVALMSRGKGALLSGPSGSGKTTIAAVLYRHFVMHAPYGQACQARWCQASDLSTARAEHRLGAGEPPALARAIGASLLVVDELGTEDERSNIADVRDVLLAREQRPTIVGTWMGPEQIAARYGAGVMRRFFEGCGVYTLGGAT